MQPRHWLSLEISPVRGQVCSQTVTAAKLHPHPAPPNAAARHSRPLPLHGIPCSNAQVQNHCDSCQGAPHPAPLTCIRLQQGTPDRLPSSQISQLELLCSALLTCSSWG